MSAAGDAIVERARALVGVRFRPQGRDPATGLDCVGAAAAAAGVPAERLRADYAMRGDHLTVIERELRELGCRPIAHDAMAPGDIMVMNAGAAQSHLAVFTGSGFIHADAGLRLVVERPMPPPWPIAAAWRTTEAG